MVKKTFPWLYYINEDVFSSELHDCIHFIWMRNWVEVLSCHSKQEMFRNNVHCKGNTFYLFSHYLRFLDTKKFNMCANLDYTCQTKVMAKWTTNEMLDTSSYFGLVQGILNSLTWGMGSKRSKCYRRSFPYFS